MTAVRFRGSTGGVAFEGWSGVTLSFGVPTAAGSVSMRTAGSINALAAEGLVASADTVSSQAICLLLVISGAMLTDCLWLKVSLTAGKTLSANVVGAASL